MTITIQIIDNQILPGSVAQAIPATQTATIAISNDGLTSYRLTVGGLDPVADAQSALNARSTELFAVAQAQGVPIGALTIYAGSHKANRIKFLNALYQLEKAVNLHTTPGLNLLADYQAALTAAMNVVNTLPAPYIDNLNAERDLASVAVAIGSMTITQARTFALLLREWLCTRAIFADTASDLLD